MAAVKKRSVGSVLEHVFTHQNPTTGSLPPEQMAWVVFEHGTAFFSAPTDELTTDANMEDLVAAARIAMAELGPVIAGTPAGDFDPVSLADWFPGESIYFVTYDHPAIATVVIGAVVGAVVGAATGVEIGVPIGEEIGVPIGEVIADEDRQTIDDATVAGLAGRSRRGADLEGLSAREIRDFHGRVFRPTGL